jgi:alpha-ketoglutarate-dependent taurine dioxygenase
MLRAGLIPERTVDPRRAFHLWSSDGAAILTTNCTNAAGTLAGARDVFGPRLFISQAPSTVAASTVSGRPGRSSGYIPVAQAATGNADVDGQPHIDGWLEFGDYYPDVVFVLCERQATAGEKWFVVDGQRLLAAIASDPTRRALSRFLWDVKLEHGPPTRGGPVSTDKRVASRRPVASRTCGGRLTVRRHPYQRLLDEVGSGPGDRQHLAAWAQVTEQAARAAPRFVLHPGDLLCLDNYRVFHGREPSAGSDRILHILWAWTDMAFGLPYPDDLAPNR